MLWSVTGALFRVNVYLSLSRKSQRNNTTTLRTNRPHPLYRTWTNSSRGNAAARHRGAHMLCFHEHKTEKQAKLNHCIRNQNLWWAARGGHERKNKRSPSPWSQTKTPQQLRRKNPNTRPMPVVKAAKGWSLNAQDAEYAPPPQPLPEALKQDFTLFMQGHLTFLHPDGLDFNLINCNPVRCSSGTTQWEDRNCKPTKILAMTCKSSELGSLLPEVTATPGCVLLSYFSYLSLYKNIFNKISKASPEIVFFFSINTMNADLDLSLGL